MPNANPRPLKPIVQDIRIVFGQHPLFDELDAAIEKASDENLAALRDEFLGALAAASEDSNEQD